MTDQLPKPTGLSKPTVPSGDDDFFNQDFSRYGMPEKDLEIGGKDIAVGLAGSTMKALGTGIAETSMGGLARGARAIADGTLAKGIADSVAEKVNPDGTGLLDGMVSFSSEIQDAQKSDPVGGAASKVGNAIGDAAEWVGDKADKVIQPATKTIGSALKSGGESVIKNGTSADYQEAVGRELYTGNSLSTLKLGSSAGDAAVWAAKMVDGIGSIGGTVAAGALTGGAVSGLVKRQMLKRGAGEELASETARLAGIKWGQRGAVAAGVNMSTGQAAEQARAQVNALSWDQLTQSQTFMDQARQIAADPEFAGKSATEILDEAKRRTGDHAASIAMSDPKTWAAAAAGTVLGDANLFKMLQGVGAKGAIKGLVQGAAGEATGEAIEEGTQRYVGNEATNKAGGQQIDPWDGVAQAAATAGTIGAFTGGMTGAIGGARGRYAPQDDGSSSAGQQQDQSAKAENAEAWDRGLPSKHRKDYSNVPPDVSDIPDLQTARKQMAGESMPGAFALATDQGNYRGVYVDINGKLSETALYATREDALTAMRQNPTFWTDEQRQENAAKNAQEIEALRAKKRNGQSWGSGSPSSKPEGYGSSQPIQAQGQDVMDTPAFVRQDGGRFKGWAEDSEVQRALAGDFGPSVAELVKRQVEQGDQGPTPQEKPIVDAMNAPLGLPHKDVIFAGDANAKQPGTEVAAPGAFDDKQAGPGPQFRGAERTRWQDGQEGDVLPPEAGGNPAGALPGRVIEGEAREVGTELPYRDVVYGQDGRPDQQATAAREQAAAAQNEQLKNAPPAIGQTDTIFAAGAPGADNKNSAYTPPRLSRDQVDTSLGEQSIRDPRTDAGQAIQQAGSEADSIFGPLKSLRITRKGKPFATEKEAVMASRKGQEMPVPLNGGGFGVAAIDEVQQAQAKQGAVKQPSSNSAKQDRQDGKTEIAQNGMVIVHGSGNPGMSEQDIQIVRASGQKQGKKGRVYGGFYGTSEQDAHQAQAYADMMGGTPTLYDVKIKPGTKVLHKQGDITRLSESYINELVSQGYGVVTGTDPRGQTEHVVIDKSAVASMAPRGTQSTPSQVDEINVADMRQPSDQPAKNVSADTVPAPSATAGKASQNQSIRQADQTVKSIDPAKQEPTAPVINEGTKQPEADNAAMPQQLPKTEPMQQQTRESSMPPTDGMAPEQNTAPAPDAGVSVSGSPRFTIEPLTDKSIIVKGDKNDAELKEKVEAAWPKAKPLYNERHKGWVFSSKREGVVREALADLIPGDVSEQKVAPVGEVAPKESPAAVQKKPAMTNKLRDVGKTLINLGRDKANQPRQSNTPKRASQAASAIRDAENMQADGETLIKIADAVDNGEAPHLSKLSSKAQYQTLNQLHRQAIPSKHMEGGEYRGHYEVRTERSRKSGVTIDDYADQIQYPTISAHPDHLRTAAKILGEIRGYKGLAEKLHYAARLVTNLDRYQPAVLNEETAKALIKAAKDTGNREVKWAAENVESGLATIDRLRRMGIDNREQLVAAIKELDAIQVPRKKENRLQQLERGLVGNKIPGYFNTQGEALKRVMEAADVKPGETVLEPSAGKGNIADAAKDAGAEVDAVERHYTLREILQEKGHNLVGDDFTALDASKQYDKVIMNPPFEQQQDIEHVRKAWDHVKPGGRLVAVMSAGVESNSNRKATEFRQWLDDNGGTMDRLPEGSFKDSDRSTGVNTVMVVMDKPISKEANKPASTGLRGTPQGVVTKESIARYQADEAQKAADNRRREQEAVGTDYQELNELVAVYSKPSPSMTEKRMAAQSRVKVSNAIKAAKGLDESYRFDKLIDSHWQSDIDQALALAKEVYSVGAEQEQSSEAAADGKTKIVTINYGGSDTSVKLDKPVHEYTREQFSEKLQEAGFGDFKVKGKVYPSLSIFFHKKRDEMIIDAHKSGANIPMYVVAEYPGIFRSDLSADQQDQMMDELRDLKGSDLGSAMMSWSPGSEAKEVYSGTKKATGNKVTVHTPGGKPVEVQYRLAEAGDLMASHDFDGSVNPLFPQELQPRDRSRAAARQQLFNIAQQPAPDRLAASAETDRGAPITKDGVVESGNGRVIGLTEAYRRGNADAYRQYLADHASDFGFTKEQIQGMKQPILVRERLTDMSADERRAFTVDSNKGASLSLGATEQAMADANGMDDAMLAKLMISEGGDVLAASNEAFLNDFATMLGNNELGTYKTQTGEWTSAYRQRVMNAIFAKGYGNSDLLSNIAESANPEVRNLLNGLMNNAGKLATLRGIDAETGATLASVYSEAANLIGKSRRDKQSIQELNSQGDMLGGGASQEAKDLAALIDTNMRSGKSISSILGNIANKLIESAKNRHQADIFSGDAHQSVTVGEAINAETSERNTNQAKQPKPGNDLFGANPARLDTRAPASVEGATARSAGGSGSGASKQGVATQEPAKIADFGQKIGGARKDVWSSYRDSIEGATAEQIAELPLSKAWPAPDYQKLIDSGVDARAVGLMRAARDAIPSKPRTGHKVKSWASAVKELRDLSMGLLDGSLDAEVVGRMMERSSLRSANNIINRADLYQAVGHQRSLADITLGAGTYSIFKGVAYSPAKTIWDISRDSKSTAFGNWPRMIATGDTKEKVIAEFKKRYDQLTSEQTKPKSVSFDIYSNDSRASWIVGKKAGRNYIPLSAPFESLADARRYREENHDALVAELEKRKAIPNERRDINQPRVGEDMRSGADVTPEMFTNAFGFRGVEFGNWVGNERRQRDLNDAYDALMDMAAVLGIHPKALSLNGELGMAFGARGSGGVTPAAAHYEPGKVVINLTKMNGAGSLGHEWWHALDNYFSRQRGAKDGMMTTARDVSLASRGLKFILQGGRQEMIEAFGAVKQAIDKTALKVRSSKLDSKRTKDYWTTDVEMSARAFESYLISKLQDQGVSNDYLANIIDEETWDSASKLGFELDSSYPYPTAGEIPGIRAGFDHLFNTIEQKVDGDKVALFSKSDSNPGTKGMDKADIEQVAKEWLEQYKGAAGVRVLVGNNQAEINEVLQMVGADIPSDGQTINAVYLPGYNTLLLNAEAIPTAERARELMRHEVLVHHGLRAVVGDDLYITILEAVKRGERIARIKDAYYQVASNYADMHPDKQAEEVFAHWAENQPERGELHLWWRSVVRKVKDALRKVGLLGPKTTEDELNRVLDAIVTGMRNGRQPGRRVMESWHDAPAYSLNQKQNHPSSLRTGLQLPLGSSMGGSEAQSGTTQGLQLPKRGSPKRVSDLNILTADDIRNSDALFSLSSATADQSILGQAESLAKAAPSTALNWLKEMRPRGLGALTDLQIDQIYREVTGGAVSQYQKLRTKMEADRNDILLDAETRIDPLWDALGKEQKKALSNLMHDATMAKLHPDLSLADNSLYQEAKDRLDKAIKPETKAKYQSELDTITANHKHLAERYNLGLNREGKALYQTMRETYDKQWADLRDAIEQRLEDLMGAEGKTLAAELRLQMESALKHGPYFPLARFGDYVVKATKGDEHIREHFERRKDAEQAIKQYQRDGYNAVMTVKEAGTGGQANSHALGMKVMQLLDEADSNGGSASSIKDDVWQAMLQMLPDASYAKHAIHRRRVKGASRDGHRAYLNSVYHYAHHVSKIRYGHKMQGELNKMNEQIQAGVKGDKSNIKPEDLEVAQQLLNEMNMRHELNMNPKGARWTGWAGNLGFMWYMAGSPASAIINMTQNFTVMLPQLGAKYGFIKAGQYIGKAMFDYVKHGKFKAGTKEAWQSLTRAESGLTADEKAMLNTLYKAGTLDLTQAHSIAARADTDLQEVKPGAAWQRKTMAWAGSLFHNAEVLNREVAALAAYRLLKEQSPNLTAEQYADQVTEMVYDGHGNYAASNRPRYMRGNVAKVMTQFKIYSQMMTYTLYRNAYLAAKGDKVALKTLGGLMGTHFIMAGVMGLPFPVTAALYGIASAFDDDDDRTGEASFRLGLSEVLGKDLGELVAKGPMDYLTGLSIAGRTGINDLWYREPKEGTEGDDLAWHVTQQIAGPVLGIGVQAARGLSMMGDGDYQRGAETMMPKALKDVAKAYRQASEGERTRKGDIIIDDVDAFNVAMQVMGFSSAEMAKAYDAREYIKGKEGRIEDERSRLLSDYFMARKGGDEDEMAEVMARIREFNNTHHRKEVITGRTIRQSVKSKMRSGDRTQGGVYLSKNREYLRAEGAFADTGE